MSAVFDTCRVQEMKARALSAIDANARHSSESLFELLGREFPDSTQEEAESVLSEVLP